MKRYGVGIVGTGNIAWAHLQAFLGEPRCQVVAVADIELERARRFAAQGGDTVAAYDDYRKLLERDDIEIVAVCTPPFVHAEISIAALEAGKHVLVEKPMAASLAEADAMIAAAHKANRKLGVVFQYRWRHDWMRAKRLIDSEHFGRTLFGKVDCLWWRGPEYYDLWWRGTWERECGGATINHAIHHIDALLWYMGEAESVYATMAAVDHDIEVEDYSAAIVTFKSGAVGQITATVAAHHNLDRIEIFGSKASLTLPWSVYAVSSQPNGFPVVNEAHKRKIEKAFDAIQLGAEGHAGQIADFVDAVGSGGNPLVDGVEGRRSLELVTAIYKSATIGERVELPMGPKDPFYTKEGLMAHVVRFATASSS